MKLLYFTVCLIIALAAPAKAMDRQLSEKILSEINLARCEPHTYAEYLRELRGRFQGIFYAQPGIATRVQTSEGVKAVDEAIKFLSSQKPLPPLTWSKGLAAAAYELADEQSRSGDTGHVGKKTRSMQERIERHGRWEHRIAENIGYGPEDPRNMVMQLIISDGVPNRGHRKNTFNMAFNTAGVACGPHPEFESMCVIDFAGKFED